MREHEDEEALLKRQRHFLLQVERDIREANREVIHAHIAQLSEARFVDLARCVAEHRARYLEAAIALSRAPLDSPEAGALLAQLPRLRQAFDETRDAFSALERAIERGYVDIAGS
ncbi:MAG TPA: hypothetical protein VFY12_05965 [Arenimonas sp.]|nr:hypothetical protein [Arenimonas sp.]